MGSKTERKFVAYTGKGGKIDYEVALHRELCKWVDKEFTPEEEAVLRKKLVVELPEGSYKIGG